MNDKKYEVKNDLKLKMLMTKETLKGYKPFLNQKELQGIVNSLYGLYHDAITIQEFTDNLSPQERIFLSSKYHNEDSYYNSDYLYHIIEYNREKYFIASDGYGNVDCLSIFNLKRIIPQVYEYANSIDSELSLEGLCHILHSLNAKCTNIEATIKHHQIEALIRAYIIDGILKDLTLRGEDDGKINEFINTLNKEFNMNIVMPEVNIKKRKKIKQ